MRVFDKTFAGIFIGGAACAIRVMPVHERVVEADAQPFGSRSFDVFTDQISAGALPGSAIVRQLRVPQAEPLVMLGGHHHVLLSGAASQPRPVACGVGFRCEVLCQQLILSDGNALVFHCPFVLADYAVKSPVNEHSKTRLMPPLHATCAVSLTLRRLFRMCVRNLSGHSTRLAVSETGCGDCAGSSECLQKMTS